MPSIFSKLLMPDWVFPYNCYEVAHTWTPSCSEASLDLASLVFQESFKMYSGLYFATQIIFSRKVDSEALKKALYSTITSSTFISFNVYTMVSAFCLLRRINNKFYYSLCAILPAFFGSLMSIYLETSSRRPTLAFYCANIASEVLFKMGVKHGYFKSVPKGEVLLFTASISILLYLVKKNGYGHDAISLALKFIMGPEEAKRRSGPNVRKPVDSLTIKNASPSQQSCHNKLINANKKQEFDVWVSEAKINLNSKSNEKINSRILKSDYNYKNHDNSGLKNSDIKHPDCNICNGHHAICLYHGNPCNDQSENNNSLHEVNPVVLGVCSKCKDFCEKLQNDVGEREGKFRPLEALASLRRIFEYHHKSCPHGSKSCASYVLEAFLKPYVMGSFGYAALNSFLPPKKFLKSPFSTFFSNLFKEKTMKFALFLGSLSSLYKLTNCILRRVSDGPKDWHALVGGLISGPTMLVSPNQTITLYVLWKSIESLFNSVAVSPSNKAIKQNIVIPVLYSASVAVIFYSIVLEPNMLRPSYMKFVDRMSGHKLHQLNRNLLAIFGNDASIGYEEYFPNLDPRLCSRKFIETILVWVI